VSTNPIISFWVAGEPQPKGSTKGWIIKGKNGGKDHVATTSNNPKLKTWELRIAHEAQAQVPKDFCDGESAFDVSCVFEFAKPKSYPKSFDFQNTKRPDIDKCLRAVLDALSNICYHDDAQVNSVKMKKIYSNNPGVMVIIERIPRRAAKATSPPCSSR
jgi:crossover junction endodeoxyribonuclease RusA